MVVLKATGVTKRFPGVVALDGVDLSLETGKVHCIVGENGAGKSTLVKILTGLYACDEGSLEYGPNDQSDNRHRNRSGSDLVAYVPQELDLFPNMSVAENIFLPFQHHEGATWVYARKNWEQRSLDLLRKLKIRAQPQDIVKNIAVSDQQLLQVARALANERSKVIILDEPTTSLTQPEIERLFEVIQELRDSGLSIVFISHKLDEVFFLGDVVTVLRNGSLTGHANLSEVSKDWVVERMTGEEVDFSRDYRPKLEAGEEVISTSELSGYRFASATFALREGEIVGFAGLVGAGRSELFQTLFGLMRPQKGQVSFRGGTWRFGDPSFSISKGVVYLSEDRKTQGILPNMSIRDNVGVVLKSLVSSLGIIRSKRDRNIARKVISDYKVKTSSMETEIRFLSGGNQQKALIGRSMELSPKVLIFDEPTKGIDVKAKEEIYLLMKRLAENGRVAIVLISSEVEELMRCANRVFAMYNGTIVGELSGNSLSTENIVSAIIGLN